MRRRNGASDSAVRLVIARNGKDMAGVVGSVRKKTALATAILAIRIQGSQVAGHYRWWLRGANEALAPRTLNSSVSVSRLAKQTSTLATCDVVRGTDYLPLVDDSNQSAAAECLDGSNIYSLYSLHLHYP